MMPSEILQRIFAKLERWHLKDCSLVCKNFFRTLCGQLLAGDFPFLKKIPQPWDLVQIVPYQLIMRFLRTRISMLELCDTIDKDRIVPIKAKNGFDKLVNGLDEFKAVKKLENRKVTNQSIDMFDKIFDSLPLVKKIDINLFDRGENGYYMDEPEDYNRNFVCDGNNYDQEIDLSLIQPLPNIKKLTGCFVLYSDQTLKYIMHKFPNLNDFDESQVSVEAASRGDNISNSALIDFVRYALNIEILAFNNIPVMDPIAFVCSFLESSPKYDDYITSNYDECFDVKHELEYDYSDDAKSLGLQIIKNTDTVIKKLNLY